VQGRDTIRLRELSQPRATLKDLAREAGVSYSLVIKVAAGKRKPNAAIRAAVERLWMKPASLVFGDSVAQERRRAQ
jgi:hypothetical protein